MVSLEKKYQQLPLNWILWDFIQPGVMNLTIFQKERKNRNLFCISLLITDQHGGETEGKCVFNGHFSSGRCFDVANVRVTFSVINLCLEINSKLIELSLKNVISALSIATSGYCINFCVLSELEIIY